MLHFAKMKKVLEPRYTILNTVFLFPGYRDASIRASIEMSNNLQLGTQRMFMQASQHTKVRYTDLYKKNTGGHVVFFCLKKHLKKKEKYAKFQKYFVELGQW